MANIPKAGGNALQLESPNCVMADGNPLRLPGSVPEDILAARLTANGWEAIDAGTIRRLAAYRSGEMFVTPDEAHDHEVRKLKDIRIMMLNYESSRSSSLPQVRSYQYYFETITSARAVRYLHLILPILV